MASVAGVLGLSAISGARSQTQTLPANGWNIDLSDPNGVIFVLVDTNQWIVLNNIGISQQVTLAAGQYQMSYSSGGSVTVSPPAASERLTPSIVGAGTGATVAEPAKNIADLIGNPNLTTKTDLFQVATTGLATVAFAFTAGGGCPTSGATVCGIWFDSGSVQLTLLSLASLASQLTSPLPTNLANLVQVIDRLGSDPASYPAGLLALHFLTGAQLPGALVQLTGEVASGVQGSAGLSAGMFLNAMLDPFVAGRTGGFGAGPSGYAPEQRPSRVEAKAREAFAAAIPVKASVRPSIFEQRWSVWGSAYGGRNSTDGEAIVGSNDRTANAAGFAAGVDYRVGPETVVGLATAIGETRWSVSGLGTGRADVAQFGGYASTRWQSFYLSGALAGAWHRASTERTVTVAGADRLEAGFDATSIAGRLEGGWRYGTAQYGVTPYAAVQVQSLRTPGYTEVALAGSNQFALTHAAQTTTDTRSELGLWGDTRHMLPDGMHVILRGRAAWVHDFDPDSRINAAFQTLPGASFTVDGASNPRDAALFSGAAEWRLRNGVTLIGKVDGEFASRSQTYAGTGTVRYVW